jgi:hypothetical protein
MSILNKIKDLSLYDTLINLKKNEYDKLEKYYGKKWFEKFFNTHHINFTIRNINKNKQQQKELTTKYSSSWYKDYIEEHKITEKKIFYSYDAKIKNEWMKREHKKKEKIKEEEIFDYTTLKKKDIQEYYNTHDIKRQEKNEKNHDKKTYSISDSTSEFSLNNSSEDMINAFDIAHTVHMMNSKNQTGGNEEQSSIESDDDNIEFEQGLDPHIVIEDEDMELEDIEKIYQDMDVQTDKNVSQTSELIKKALNDDKIFKKIKSKLNDYDQSKDNLMHDEQLKNVFKKYYVINQYIFKDDTVKMIKNKICCGIKNNSKFGKNAYIVPSRQYLLSEYYLNNKVEKIMIGQKWIKRSDLLHIDVEPNNNIRVYEELRGRLKLLRDNIKRYGSKIKREDDDFNILYDYDGYYTNNELFMIDAYNELGKDYSPDAETLKNISDVFIRVYFPRIKQDDIKYIIDFLQGDTKIEENKISTIYETINNDLVIENQIMRDVESIKKIPTYRSIFKQNYITQSVIHVNLIANKEIKMDLFRIFNEFITTNKYPFIQYQTADGQIVFKYNDKDIIEYSNKKENIDVLSKWFENAPYGISFKVRIIEREIEKFMAINLNENGRIEYKTQWKEEDMATIDDIKKTYNYVKNLIRKINLEKNKAKFDIPQNNEFKYAFINTIQKFELPEKFIINHNDLSEFSRYFYPYIALVIEPRKRQSKIKKIDEKSKFGTYLRYKRVSKYENQARIEQRVLYFMRNYDYSDQLLADEIGKQFNITKERAMEEIERVRGKYPNIKRSRKILKRLENIPKYKPPGIGIDIQGKQRDKYKIRISGARTKKQLNRIIEFMNILIYLYVETYLYKRPERQILKQKLTQLTNIARRRNRVDDVINYEKTTKTVKHMTQLDKKRIGFKPEKGQNQWTRSCQNSGNDKKRRPQQYISTNELSKNGFKFNKKIGIYEKMMTMKGRKGKQKNIILRAVELGGDIENKIFYSCNPKENGEHMFIGFLSRSNNPYGQCMPCCFKKDPVISKNKEKQEYFMRCIGKMDEKEIVFQKIIGDRLYILQDTNKIQEGRFGFLPKYLDYFFNKVLNKVRKIKHHYLINTGRTGYYFKFGSRQDKLPFLNAIASLLDITIEQIKKTMIDTLKNDKNEQIFTALNNGDVKTQFKSIEQFINFIKTNGILSFNIFNYFISLPNILSKNGLNIIIFEKQTTVIKKALEKEKTRDDFLLMCQNYEDDDNLLVRDSVFIVKENKNYYPIVLVKKEDEETKTIVIEKIFKHDKKEENIINHVLDFYKRNCETNIIKDLSKKHNILIAKQLYKILYKINEKKYLPKFQVIDARNKCKYFICNNGTIIPVKPSGSIHNLFIIKTMENKVSSVKDTMSNMEELYKLSKSVIPIKPIGFYYDSKTKDKTKIIAVMTLSYDVVPIKEEIVETNWVYKQGLILEHKQLFDKIDEEITKGRNNYVIDKRINEVNYRKYLNESYELFRLELSEYLDTNNTLKEKIIRIVSNDKLIKEEKKNLVKTFLYRITDKSLLDEYNKITNQKGGKNEKFVHIINKIPELKEYAINNNRDECGIHENRDQCSLNHHCRWSHNNCYFALTKDMVITFINKISEELINDSLKVSEILKKEDYFVSDIVDYNRFTEREGQKIIKSTNYAIDKVLGEIFGKENAPTIGKRRGLKLFDVDYQQMNIDNSLQNMGKYYTQNIIENNLTLLRSFANGYFWSKQKYYELERRNLGYYSNLQTNLANYFKSVVVDWIMDTKNIDMIKNDMTTYIDVGKKRNIVHEFLNKISKNISTITNGVVEFYVLNKVYNIVIYVYDENNEVIYLFDDGVVYDSNKQEKETYNSKQYKKYHNIELMKNSVNIKFTTVTNFNIPSIIENIYYK